MSLRQNLVEIQKRLVKRIKRQIYSSVRSHRHIQKYYEEFKQVTGNYDKISNKQELLEKALQSDIIYVGDFHTLSQSQKVFLKLLEDISASEEYRRNRKGIIVCLEMFLNRHGEYINAFLDNRITETEFLEKTDYNRTWGFEWAHYKPVIEFARANHFRIEGLNSNPAKRQTGLVSRDKFAARIIAKLSAQNPGYIVTVLFGDLHITENHLPGTVDAILQKNGKERKKLIVHQNIERLYWKLAEQELEHIADVLKLNEYSFSVMSTPPLVKFQSYFNWQENAGELQYQRNPEWTASKEMQIDFLGQITEIIKAFCNFLEIPVPDMGDLTIYAMDDLNLLEKIRHSPDISAKEVENIEISILKRESMFIPQGNIIYLSSLSINHAAEEAAHYVYYKCSKAVLSAAMTKTDRFYLAIMRNALGYLGSKIINHKRLCYKEKDFEIFLTSNIDRKLRDPKLKELKKITISLLRHKEKERVYLNTGEWLNAKKLYPDDLSLNIGVTHALGYILGEKLYSAMIQDFITKQELKELFCTDFTLPDCAFSTYLSLIKKLQFVKDLYESKTEKM
ncbi:MAG: ChaN family lipoprotein [Planctomycetes bacterium]|nr:ChaN family lipoprotein [Planctomycetota bacterium]